MFLVLKSVRYVSHIWKRLVQGVFNDNTSLCPWMRFLATYVEDLYGLRVFKADSGRVGTKIKLNNPLCHKYTGPGPELAKCKPDASNSGPTHIKEHSEHLFLTDSSLSCRSIGSFHNFLNVFSQFILIGFHFQIQRLFLTVFEFQQSAAVAYDPKLMQVVVVQ